MREDSTKVATVLLASPALKVDTANAAGETPLMMAARAMALKTVSICS